MAGRADERRRIGHHLHQGILQDLTVAGLRLAAMQKTPMNGLSAEVAQFADWLRDRQADLRRYVGDLETGSMDHDRVSLDDLAAEMIRHGRCTLSVDPNIPVSLRAQFVGAVTSALASLVRFLDEQQGATAIDIILERDAPPRLRLSHDGNRIVGDDGAMHAMRPVVGRAGASLSIEAVDGLEVVILDWAA